jgi:hypothetical protein
MTTIMEEVAEIEKLGKELQEKIYGSKLEVDCECESSLLDVIEDDDIQKEEFLRSEGYKEWETYQANSD